MLGLCRCTDDRLESSAAFSFQSCIRRRASKAEPDAEGGSQICSWSLRSWAAELLDASETKNLIGSPGIQPISLPTPPSPDGLYHCGDIHASDRSVRLCLACRQPSLKITLIQGRFDATQWLPCSFSTHKATIRNSRIFLNAVIERLYGVPGQTMPVRRALNARSHTADVLRDR